MTDTKKDGTGAKKQHAAQGSAEHVPFVCKAKSSGKRRNLAGHVQLTLRVAVAGVNGSTSVLDTMKKTDYTDYIMVADAAGSHGRALAAHAKTLMYAKGWEKDGLKEQNACFEFDLLKADKVTKIKATSHSTTAGTYLSKEIAIDALPDCVKTMASAGDPHDRRLAGHAGKCARVENGASPCPKSKSPAPAASSATTYSVVTAAVVGVLALFL
jgi:ribosomal silencing factor RsfS